jgi:hypothetical protein
VRFKKKEKELLEESLDLSLSLYFLNFNLTDNYTKKRLCFFFTSCGQRGRERKEKTI